MISFRVAGRDVSIASTGCGRMKMTWHRLPALCVDCVEPWCWVFLNTPTSIRGIFAMIMQVSSTLIRAYFSPAHTTGQRLIVSGSSDGNVCMWDVVTGENQAAW